MDVFFCEQNQLDNWIHHFRLSLRVLVFFLFSAYPYSLRIGTCENLLDFPTRYHHKNNNKYMNQIAWQYSCCLCSVMSTFLVKYAVTDYYVFAIVYLQRSVYNIHVHYTHTCINIYIYLYVNFFIVACTRWHRCDFESYFMANDVCSLFHLSSFLFGSPSQFACSLRVVWSYLGWVEDSHTTVRLVCVIEISPFSMKLTVINTFRNKSKNLTNRVDTKKSWRFFLCIDTRMPNTYAANFKQNTPIQSNQN